MSGDYFLAPPDPELRYSDHHASAGGNPSFNIFLPSDAVPSAFDVTDGNGGRMIEDGNGNGGQDISIADFRFPTSPVDASAFADYPGAQLFAPGLPYPLMPEEAASNIAAAAAATAAQQTTDMSSMPGSSHVVHRMGQQQDSAQGIISDDNTKGHGQNHDSKDMNDIANDDDDDDSNNNGWSFHGDKNNGAMTGVIQSSSGPEPFTVEEEDQTAAAAETNTNAASPTASASINGNAATHSSDHLASPSLAQPSSSPIASSATPPAPASSSSVAGEAPAEEEGEEPEESEEDEPSPSPAENKTVQQTVGAVFNISSDITSIRQYDAIAQRPAARALVLRAAQLPEQMNLSRKSNSEAVFLQVAGAEPPRPCESCVRNYGPFTTCVTFEGRMNGACCNCWYNACGKRCEFHHANVKAARQRHDDYTKAMEAGRERPENFALPESDITQIFSTIRHAVPCPADPDDDDDDGATVTRPVYTWTEETMTNVLADHPLSSHLLRAAADVRSISRHQRYVNRLTHLVQEVFLTTSDYQAYIRTEQGRTEKRAWDQMVSRVMAAWLERVQEHFGFGAAARARAGGATTGGSKSQGRHSGRGSGNAATASRTTPSVPDNNVHTDDDYYEEESSPPPSPSPSPSPPPPPIPPVPLLARSEGQSRASKNAVSTPSGATPATGFEAKGKSVHGRKSSSGGKSNKKFSSSRAATTTSHSCSAIASLHHAADRNTQDNQQPARTRDVEASNEGVAIEEEASNVGNQYDDDKDYDGDYEDEEEYDGDEDEEEYYGHEDDEEYDADDDEEESDSDDGPEDHDDARGYLN
ncbi:hypothetical protein N3K66_008233 [Trichothecium roseum]|uniref:Uncharacterized protein n=1 Tax=Trichothecium roseum TaxID=47278 RepID=A0ACC0UU81_9HYPO|nr:hypothetical protein N3K66_008233 [Trichothecium roseum]